MELFLHYFTPERLRVSKSSIWKVKKSEVTKTSEQSGLEAEIFAQEILRLFTWAIEVDECRWKKIDETSSVTSTAFPSVRYAQRRSFRSAVFELRDNSVVRKLILLG